MNNKNAIVGMTLEGFQVFAEPTHIPLERLTLMFGPNSVGKSAVYDAMETFELLQALENNGLVGTWLTDVGKQLRANLSRHWRRTEVDGLANLMRISVQHRSFGNWDNNLAKDLDRELGQASSQREYVQLETVWTLFLTGGEFDEYPDYRMEFELYIESKLFVSSNFSGRLTVNLDHPILQSIPLTCDFIAVANEHSEDVSYENGFFTFLSGIYGFNSNGGEHENREHWLSYIFKDSPKNVRTRRVTNGPSIEEEIDRRKQQVLNTQSWPLLSQAVRETSLIVGTVLSNANQGSRFKPSKVDASRNTPSRADLTFLFGPSFHDSMQGIGVVGNPRYERLAKSLSIQAIISHAKLSAIPNRETKLATDINRALTTQMNTGYTLDYEHRVLLSKANSNSALNGEVLDPSEFGHLVEVVLRGRDGRKYHFEDVGSGVGYVLPVLCAIYERAKTAWKITPTYFIQQPELHLHPKMQAAFGDVAIEGSRDKQVLFETHSEHFILRVLRRVRETYANKDISPELRIVGDEVCVLYFQPMDDGSTKVKRLRVSKDGDFMDRWPDGFFEERDAELFDE